MSLFGFWQKFVRIGFHAVSGGRWIVKWRLDGDEMETMRGTDRSIGNPAEHQASDFLKNSIWILIQYTMSIK